MQYITDSDGNNQGVILSLAEWEELREDLHDLAVVAERHDEPTVSHEQLTAELKKDGLL
jgi:PHD/YefM family antitoxin component YafN of YafNO toxin-antitoxin module